MQTWEIKLLAEKEFNLFQDEDHFFIALKKLFEGKALLPREQESVGEIIQRKTSKPIFEGEFLEHIIFKAQLLVCLSSLDPAQLSASGIDTNWIRKQEQALLNKATLENQDLFSRRLLASSLLFFFLATIILEKNGMIPRLCPSGTGESCALNFGPHDDSCSPDFMVYILVPPAFILIMLNLYAGDYLYQHHRFFKPSLTRGMDPILLGLFKEIDQRCDEMSKALKIA